MHHVDYDTAYHSAELSISLAEVMNLLIRLRDYEARYCADIGCRARSARRISSSSEVRVVRGADELSVRGSGILQRTDSTLSPSHVIPGRGWSGWAPGCTFVARPQRHGGQFGARIGWLIGTRLSCHPSYRGRLAQAVHPGPVGCRRPRVDPQAAEPA